MQTFKKKENMFGLSRFYRQQKEGWRQQHEGATDVLGSGVVLAYVYSGVATSGVVECNAGVLESLAPPRVGASGSIAQGEARIWH